MASNASKASPERQRIQLVQAQSLQLAPQQQVQQVANSNLSNRAVTKGVHRNGKRLKVAVDVDEGTPQPAEQLMLDKTLWLCTKFAVTCSARKVPA